MSTTTNLSTLKINYLTQAQYDDALANNQINENEIYLTPNLGTPIGIIQMYGGSTAPTGWLLCDGSTVSRTTYSALFAVIDTTYGPGDGSTTFNLPNFNGRVPIGTDTDYALGATGGSALNSYTPAGTIGSHTLTTSEIPAHTHGSKTLTGSFKSRRWSSNGELFSNATGIVSASTNTSDNYNSAESSGKSAGRQTITITATHTHDSVGGGGGHDHTWTGTAADISTIQPWIGINYIIYAGK